MAELASIERWYSLSIVDRDARYGLRWPTSDKIPIKSFRSLRVLSIDAVTRTELSAGSQLDFLMRIAQCRPRLYHLRIIREKQLTIVTFEAGPEAFDMLPDASFPKLREVTIDGSFWVTNAEQLWKIPSSANLTILNCSPWLISALSTLNIETLHVDGLLDWNAGMLGSYSTILRLPNLRTLSMKPCLPYHLKIFDARDTQSVRLSGAYKSDLETVRKETEALTRSLLTDVRHLKIYPTSLTIRVEGITDRTLVVMLEAWPQLQHLSIILGGTFDLFGILTQRLKDKKEPLCPKLETMYVEVGWSEQEKKWRRWRELAKEIMARRRAYPLRSMTWRNNSFSAESVTRDTVN
ncbi:hypothetical protein FRC17_010261 [Serendipita sp. 399]|nr:hypothetical protein FRC17_010261 [Serendipita sp. 399]